MQLLTHFRAAFGSPFSIQRIRFLWARMCFETNYSTTEYEHDISPFYWKSTYYKQGWFVDSTPEYGVRTVGFHILLYINIIPKQHVRSPATLNVTSGVVNALALRMTENRDVYWEYRIYATEREPATQMSGDVTEMSWNHLLLQIYKLFHGEPCFTSGPCFANSFTNCSSEILSDPGIRERSLRCVRGRFGY